MPRWRPLGTSKAQLYSQDGNDCALKVVGRCLLPDADTIIGDNAPNALSLDHILEQAHFGSDHRPENLLTVHRLCNTVRGKRPFVRFVGRENARRIAQSFPRVAPTILQCLGG
jgi:hypothetical protein